MRLSQCSICLEFTRLQAFLPQIQKLRENFSEQQLFHVRAACKSCSALFGFACVKSALRIAPLVLFGRIVMVEMAGVEPASESISTGISPSAADDLNFAFLGTRQQVHKSASPLFPGKAGLTCRVFLYGRCQTPYLQVNMG